MTPADIRAALSDVNALVCTLDGEAEGEPIASQIGVACAIRNRVDARGPGGVPMWWGNTFAGVCLHVEQFSCWWGTGPDQARVYDLAQALIVQQTTGDIIAQLQWIAHGVIERQIRDQVNGATHYVTTALWRSNPPPWARGLTPVAVLGAHSFFKGIQ